MRKNHWNRLLWGIRFADATGSLFLIGTRWHRVANERNQGYPGEPSRALLFNSRKLAREYCREHRAAAIELGGTCAKWRYAPVRVREAVRATRNGFGDGK